MLSDHFCSADVTELAKAMVKVQQALTPACKDAENPFAKNRYATLNSVIDACRDALAGMASGWRSIRCRWSRAISAW